VIGGSQGEDRGSDAALPVDNKFRSEVNDYHSDDHSFDLDAKKTVIEPGHGRRPHHHKAREEVIQSNDGLSEGSTYVKPQVHAESNNENSYYEDDHSVELAKDVVEVVPPHGHPKHHHARGEHEDIDVIGGPGGIDTGNSFALPITSKFSSTVNDAYVDDHSRDIDIDTTIVKPKSHPPSHFKARGEHEHVDVIGGAEGIDTGNTFDMPITSKFSSEVNDAYIDDHSRDIDRDTTIVNPKHHGPGHFKARTDHEDVDLIGGPEGVDVGNTFDLPITSKFSSTVNDAYVDDHSRDIAVDKTVVSPHHHKARGEHEHVDVIGGPGGVDTGNTVSIPITSKFSSTVNDYYQDDHSRDIDVDKTVVKPHHHKARGSHEHVNVIGGPGGVDTGNTFDMPITSKFSSVVNDAYVDDHSFDLDKDTTIVRPHHRREGVDVIGGPGGVDTGNTFDLPITSKFSSEVNDYYQDDHSRDIDLDKTVVKPHHHKARGGQEHVDVIGGPSGIDTGNTFDMPITSKFSSEVNDYYKDDHSWDLDYDKTIVRPHHKRQDGDHGEHGEHVDVIGGPGGVDTGNTFDLPITSKFSSEVNDYYQDDHSWDVDVNKKIVHKRQHGDDVDLIGGPEGVDIGNTFSLPITSKFSSEVNDYYQDDHSWDVDVGKKIVNDYYQDDHSWDVDVGKKIVHKRQHGDDVDLIGGPEGVDIGNTFSLPITSKFSSEVNDYYQDDHSWDVDVGKKIVHKRQHGDDVDLIGGPEGVDIGNTFSLPITSKFSSEVNDYYQDDHSRDIDTDTTIVQPHHHKARGHGEQVDVIGGAEGVDIGNSVDIPISNSFKSKVNEQSYDDHSVDIDISKHHARRGEDFSILGGPSGVDVGNSVVLPFTNTVDVESNSYHKDDHSVHEQVTTTIDPAPAPAPAPEPAHEETKPEEPKAEPHVDEPPKQPEPKASTSCEPTVQEVVRTVTHTLPTETTVAPKVDAVATEAPAPTHSALAPSEPTKSAAQSNPTHEAAAPTNPFTPNLDEAHHVPGSEPSATSVVQSAITTAAPARTEPVVMDKVASSITIQQDSTFHVIPVYVPQSSATTPSSFAVSTAVTSVVGPHSTGVDAYEPTLRYNLPPAAPSASPTGVLFTGAGAPQAAPYAGVFSVFSGLVALLALIL
ncbi:hypothetical protein ASPACDRAFT_10329, partial [Aspergillus aculeatus ATCC 16872]